MDNPTQTNVSPFFVIGFVFLMNGIVMMITLGFAIGIAFVINGFVFLILGLTSKGEKSEVPGSGSSEAVETPRPE